MATTVSTRSSADTVAGDQCVTLRGLDWKGYLTMLRLRGEHPAPRMVYLDGELLLVSPSYSHETLKKGFGLFVHEIVACLKLPCKSSGSTTFRRRRKRGGVEGDETYYLANAGQVVGKKDIDLRIDPPPDLAIEVVHTHDATASVEVYRRLGVPEVWVCDGDELEILVRQANGRYARAESSLAFPFLKATEIFDWVNQSCAMLEADWTSELQRWIQDTLIPRRGPVPPS